MRAVLFLAMLAATLPPLSAGAAESSADKAAARRISNYLQHSGQLRNYRIGVTYKDGVATLAGTVASPEQRETAIQLAEQIEGVAQVECRLQCPESAERADVKRPSGSVARASATQPAANGMNLEPGVVQAAGKGLAPAPRPQQLPPQQLQPAPRAQQMPPRQMQRRRPMNGSRPMRGNMPLPQRRFTHDPAVRPASAQGVQLAGGMPCEAPGPGMMPGACEGGMMGGGPAPMGFVPHGHARGPSYENAQLPGYAWPSYAAYPNYAALSYPQQYSPTAWPYIGPFYPYPQVPLAWRKVSLEWDDGWWFLDFSAHNSSH